MCDVHSHDNSPPLDVSKDQIEDFSESNKEFCSIDDDSFSIDDIDYVEASPPDSELVSLEVMEIVISEVGGIDDDILLMIEHDDLREKLRNVNLLISKIEALNVNPTPSFDCKTKSPSTSLNSLLDETNTFDNSLPEFETFCFDVEEISSGSTTTHPDISLPEYEAFYDDHVKEIDSGSPTTHSDISLSEYDSFMFDLSINSFPPADRSDSYEFTDELIPFISAPEYDCFRFTVDPNSRDFTKDVVENISHRSGTVKKFNTHRSHLNECLMLIHGQNTPLLDKWVPLSLMIAFGVPNWENKDFKNLTTTRASFVGSALALTHFDNHATSNYSIGAGPKKIGIVPEIMSCVLEKLLLLLSSHTLDNEVPRVVKENQEKDKIRSKPNKNGKCGKAGKSQKQLQ
nr:hypothetical protein [Tanacetum cinerariifolium]